MSVAVALGKPVQRLPDESYALFAKVQFEHMGIVISADCLVQFTDSASELYGRGPLHHAMPIVRLFGQAVLSDETTNGPRQKLASRTKRGLDVLVATLLSNEACITRVFVRHGGRFSLVPNTLSGVRSD